MKKIRVKITTVEQLLGTASNNKEIHQEFIASKAPDAPSMEEEVAAVGAAEVFDKSMTVFPRDDAGNPIMWDYQIKGFFKDSCQMLRKVPGSECSKIKAFKKEIDGLVFVYPRQIPIKFDGEIGICERPLRAQTAQGERIALASSESIPAGATLEFEIKLMLDSHEKFILECLDYGQDRGLGQWRNSGCGKVVYEAYDEDGNWISGTNAEAKK